MSKKETKENQSNWALAYGWIGWALILAIIICNKGVIDTTYSFYLGIWAGINFIMLGVGFDNDRKHKN